MVIHNDFLQLTVPNTNIRGGRGECFYKHIFTMLTNLDETESSNKQLNHEKFGKINIVAFF